MIPIMIYNDAVETADRDGSSQAVNVNVLICRLPSCMHVTNSSEERHVTARPWLQRTMFQNMDSLQPLNIQHVLLSLQIQAHVRLVPQHQG